MKDVIRMTFVGKQWKLRIELEDAVIFLSYEIDYGMKNKVCVKFSFNVNSLQLYVCKVTKKKII